MRLQLLEVLNAQAWSPFFLQALGGWENALNCPEFNGI